MTLEQEIIRGATELFRVHGLQFTMQDIASQIHISKKTIYTRFPSKQALLMAMVEDAFSAIHRRKAELIAGGGTAAERLRRVIIALPEEYQALDFRKLAGLGEKYPEVAAQVRRQLETGWEPTLRLLEEAMDAGQVRRIPVPVFRMMVTASIEAFLSTDGLCPEGISYQEALESMIDILMDGIRGRENAQPMQ